MVVQCLRLQAANAGGCSLVRELDPTNATTESSHAIIEDPACCDDDLKIHNLGLVLSNK